VPFDQNFKRLEIPALRSKAEGQVALSGRLSIEAIAACSLSMLSVNLDGTIRLRPKSHQSDRFDQHRSGGCAALHSFHPSTDQE